jgi:hypothetical protein
MRLKTTEELVDIWIKNNRAEWTGEAFEVIQELLSERLTIVPEQGKPNYERVDLWSQDILNFLKSTSFLTSWSAFLFFGIVLLGLWVLRLFFGDDVPFIYINILLILAFPIPITSGFVMIKRREVAQPGIRIKGWVAVVEGIIVVIICTLAELVFLIIFFQHIYKLLFGS